MTATLSSGNAANSPPVGGAATASRAQELSEREFRFACRFLRSSGTPHRAGTGGNRK